MVIIEDTRQQANKHNNKESYFAEHGITVARSKLIVGDYARLDNQTVSIDTKRNIIELAGNICGKQHERFREECERARDLGIKLIILVEEIPPRGDLALWQSPKTKGGKLLTAVKGETLKKAMLTMTKRYGVRFEFTTKYDSPKRIVDILRAAE